MKEEKIQHAGTETQKRMYAAYRANKIEELKKEKEMYLKELVRVNDELDRRLK